MVGFYNNILMITILKEVLGSKKEHLTMQVQIGGSVESPKH